MSRLYFLSLLFAISFFSLNADSVADQLLDDFNSGSVPDGGNVFQVQV